MQYRPEIDGLRAVAVMPVILFHAGFPQFRGGYVGVDVFFVISGFLITSLLINEVRQEGFSIGHFYERRARRILPALFVVTIACIPFAYSWMLPKQLEEFSTSIVSVVVFLSNFYFLSQVNYFAPNAELQPLLHTWSLAIEEQYYLIIPLLLVAMRRSAILTNALIILSLVIASFAFSEWAWRENAERSFFFTLSRFWEIGIGSLCAFLAHGKKNFASNVLSALGLALILISIFIFHEGTPFPSVYTLVPVIGTALIILFAGKDTWVTRLLSLRVFVGIGLISYSAYLWHQPLFAFARIRSLAEPSQGLMLLLACVSLLLAWVTWYWIEQPFRRRTNPLLASKRGVFTLSASVGAMLLASGLFGILGTRSELALDAKLLRYVEAVEDRASDSCNFDLNRPANFHPQPQCLSSGGRAIDVILIGDSHMWSISDAVRIELDKRGIGYYSVSHSSCLPLFGFNIFDGPIVTECEDFLRAAFRWATQNDVSTVVLAARFPLYLHGSRFNNGEGGVEFGVDGWADLKEVQTSHSNDAKRRERVLLAYEDRLRSLAEEFRIVLVYPIPEAGWDVPSYGFKNAYFNGIDGSISTSYQAYIARTKEVNSLFDRLVSELPNVFAARVYEVFCKEDNGRCINADSSGVYYYDDDHLSNSGARLIAPLIVDSVEAALRSEGRLGED